MVEVTGGKVRHATFCTVEMEMDGHRAEPAKQSAPSEWCALLIFPEISISSVFGVMPHSRLDTPDMSFARKNMLI
jgi:hypothetical protein